MPRTLSATLILAILSTSAYGQEAVVRLTHDAGSEVAPWEPVTYTVEIEFSGDSQSVSGAQFVIRGSGQSNSLQSDYLEGAYLWNGGADGGDAIGGLDFAPYSFTNLFFLSDAHFDNPLEVVSFTLAAGCGDLDARLDLVPFGTGEVLRLGRSAFGEDEKLTIDQVRVELPAPVRVVGPTSDTTLVIEDADFSGQITGGEISALEVMPNGEIAIGGRFDWVDGVRSPDFARWNGAEWVPQNRAIRGFLSKYHRVGDSMLITGALRGTNDSQKLLRFQNGQTVSLASWQGVYTFDTAQAPDGAIYLAGISNVLPDSDPAELIRYLPGTGLELLPLVGAEDGVWTPRHVDSIDVLPDGRLVVADYHRIDVGPVQRGGVTVYDGTNAEPLGGATSPYGGCRSVVVAVDGDAFVTCAGVLLRWDGTAWHEVGERLIAVKPLPDGRLLGVLETGDNTSGVPVVIGDDGVEIYGQPTDANDHAVLGRGAVVGPNGEMVAPRRSPGRQDGGTSVWSLGRFETSPLSPCCRVIDFDQNQAIDASDAVAFVGQFIDGDVGADLNQDGFLDIADVGALVRLYTSGCQ